MYNGSIWKIIDKGNKDGYKFDDMKTHSITSGLGSSSKQLVNLLVVMSKY